MNWAGSSETDCIRSSCVMFTVAEPTGATPRDGGASDDHLLEHVFSCLLRVGALGQRRRHRQYSAQRDGCQFHSPSPNSGHLTGRLRFSVQFISSANAVFASTHAASASRQRRIR